MTLSGEQKPRFALIAADTRNRDDEWIEYGWSKCFINVEKKGTFKRGLESAILYRQSDINPDLFEPYGVVDKYHTIEPNAEIDKRLAELIQRNKLTLLQQSRITPDDLTMVWVIQPKNGVIEKETQIGNRKFYTGVIVRNNEGAISPGITVYPLIYETIGEHTITPFVFQNYKIKGVRIAKDPSLYERSVIGLNDQFSRCARKAKGYLESLKLAHETKVREDIMSMILRHYITINEDYLPGYIYNSRSMRENRVDITIMEEGRDKTLLDVCYDIVDSIWEYKQKRLPHAVVSVARLTNGLLAATEHIRLNKEFTQPLDDDQEQIIPIEERSDIDV